MKQYESELSRMMVKDVEIGNHEDGYLPLKLITRLGGIHCRYYRPEVGAKLGAIWVGGVGGDWDTPAGGLYPRLCEELKTEAIASLRLRYRYSTRLPEAVPDVLAGISYLQDEGIESIALIGHSFGGAVVIQAAAQVQAVRTVVAIAPQAFGADPASKLATRCSLLLLHGEADPVLSPQCSEHIYDIAYEPKRLILYADAGHGLDEVSEEVHDTVRDWLAQELNRPKV